MDKEIKKYIAAVRRKLNLPGKIKTRVLSDLQTTITARLEAGESWKQVRESLGTPAKAAAGLNEQMKEFAYRKSPWRFAFLAVAVAAGIKVLLDVLSPGIAYLIMRGMEFTRPEAGSVGIIGGADGPTAIFLTVPDWIYAAFWIVLLILGIAGFIRLGRCKRK